MEHPDISNWRNAVNASLFIEYCGSKFALKGMGNEKPNLQKISGIDSQ